MKRHLPLLGLAFALAACGGGSGSPDSPSGFGTLELRVGDAPFAHGMVEEATIGVDTIRVRRDDASGGGFVTLYDDVPIEIDLLALRDGVTQSLATAQVPAGAWDQIRLVISSAYLRLTDGDEFSTDVGNLHLTSTGTSGLKLNVDPPLQVIDGVATTVLLDIDLTKTFHAVPGDDLFNASFYQLHPVVHVVSLSESGEFRGTVTESDGAGGFVGIANATVYVLASGEPDLANALQTTATTGDGSYAVLGVMPGTYDLLAEEGSRQVRSNGHSVAAGSVTVVDFVRP
jgi:hypothetical protein